MARWVKFTPVLADDRHFADYIDADRIIRAAVQSTHKVEGGKSVTTYHTLIFLDTNRIMAVHEGPDHFGIKALEPPMRTPIFTTPMGLMEPAARDGASSSEISTPVGGWNPNLGAPYGHEGQ